MALSREDIGKIAKEAADKVIESQGKCVSAGMQLFEAQQGYRKATPIIFRANLKGLVSEDDLKVPHSEAAIHVGAAGKNIIAFSLVGESAAFVVYDDGEGRCGFTFGLEGELFNRPLVEKVKEMWEKRGPGGNPAQPQSLEQTAPRSSRLKELEAEAQELQLKIRAKYPEHVPEPWPEELQRWQGRLWQLGFEITREKEKH
jgi:hypothetical protein